jgi:1-acyl-sn-glycerol-3-phosphate acyltransferase
MAEAVAGWPHAGLRGVTEIAARVYFRRFSVVGRGRFPRRGATVVVANHPAAWTDVVVLDAALDRRLHFLAQESLFHPWARGVFLRLHGSLPVSSREEGDAHGVDNRAVFARCHALLRRGEAIAVFPEGVSEWDRTIGPLKTGAAWLMLEDEARGPAAPRLVPVAIHYENRMAFRSAVTLAVGPDIGVEAHRDLHARDSHSAAHALTDDIRNALEAAFTEAAAAAHRRVGEDREAPSDAARGGAPARRWVWMLAAPAVLLGRGLHALPVVIIEGTARSLTGLPPRLAFGRILFGLVVIPLWYALLLAGALALGGGAWLAVPIAAPGLGWLACLDHDRRMARAGAGHGTPAVAKETSR